MPASTSDSALGLTPKWCLKHIQKGYDVEALSKDQRADFAMSLQKRAGMTWGEILLAHKHGLGSEQIPAKQIKPGKPKNFEGQDKFLVLRYSGKLPMVGVRSHDTFHIVWIERAFGEVYDHGK